MADENIVKCQFCDNEISEKRAFYGKFDDKMQSGWICEDHIKEIITIAHLTFEKNNTLHHLYSATREELKELIDDNKTTKIKIIKAEINQNFLMDRWKPKKRSECYK